MCSEQGYDTINKRLEDLEHEWDIERTSEANDAISLLLYLQFVNTA